MNLLDMIAGYQQAGQEPDYQPMPYVPGGPTASTPAPTPSGPNIIDLLTAAAQPKAAPTIPAPNTAGILPMALLRFAADVTRPRGYKQSSANAILSAGSRGLEYADKLKGEATASAERSAATQAKLEESAAQTQEARIGSVAKAQAIKNASDRAPLELEKLRAAIEASKSEQELNGIKTRVAKVQERYAAQLEEAKLAEKNARTDAEKAQAAMMGEHAKLYKKQADELLAVAELRAKGAAGGGMEWVAKDDGLGGRPEEFNRRTGERRPGRFRDVQSALRWAQDEIKAMEDLGLMQGKDKTTELRRLIAEAGPAAGNTASGKVVPAEAGGLGPAAPPAQANPTVSKEDQGGYDEALKRSATGANATKFTGKGGVYYFVKGREVSLEEFNRLVGRK